MKTEKECKSDSRFLFTDLIISGEAINALKHKFLVYPTKAKQHYSKAFHQFMDWHKQDNEVVLFTFYAYADLAIPKHFDCIFDFNNLESVVFTNFYLTQVIYETLFPIDCIEHGHKHICVFRFEEDVPQILNLLPETVNDSIREIVPAPKLGICNREDFEEIKSRLIYTRLLQKKHGQNWWMFDEQEQNT